MDVRCKMEFCTAHTCHAVSNTGVGLERHHVLLTAPWITDAGRCRCTTKTYCLGMLAGHVVGADRMQVSASSNLPCIVPEGSSRNTTASEARLSLDPVPDDTVLAAGYEPPGECERMLRRKNNRGE